MSTSRTLHFDIDHVERTKALSEHASAFEKSINILYDSSLETISIKIHESVASLGSRELDATLTCGIYNNDW